MSVDVLDHDDHVLEMRLLTVCACVHVALFMSAFVKVHVCLCAVCT